MSNWSDQFFKSQANFFTAAHYNPSIPTQEFIEELTTGFAIIERDAFKSALTTLANQELCKLASTTDILLSKCESPIEKQMALALWICGNSITGENTTIDLSDYTAGIPEPYQIVIKPQTKIGDYRVDFLLQYRTIIPKIENHKIVRDFESCKQLIIECDGHDFHEKTKEQAKKDKERDRIMQSLGFLVFRYTGSEIWTDVFKCAKQSINTIISSADEEAQKWSQA